MLTIQHFYVYTVTCNILKFVSTITGFDCNMLAKFGTNLKITKYLLKNIQNILSNRYNIFMSTVCNIEIKWKRNNLKDERYKASEI